MVGLGLRLLPSHLTLVITNLGPQTHSAMPLGERLAKEDRCDLCPPEAHAPVCVDKNAGFTLAHVIAFMNTS